VTPGRAGQAPAARLPIAPSRPARRRYPVPDLPSASTRAPPGRKSPSPASRRRRRRAGRPAWLRTRWPASRPRGGGQAGRPR